MPFAILRHIPAPRERGPYTGYTGAVFAFTTILGWAYYGEKAAEYLFGAGITKYYRVLWVMAVMTGSVSTLTAVWSFSDVANGLMAVPNLIALLALNGVIVDETRRHLWNAHPTLGIIAR